MEPWQWIGDLVVYIDLREAWYWPLVEIWGEDFMEYRIEGFLISEDAPMENYVSQTVAVTREVDEPAIIPDGTYYLREVRKRRDAMRGLQTYVTIILWEYDASYYVSVT